MNGGAHFIFEGHFNDFFSFYAIFLLVKQNLKVGGTNSTTLVCELATNHALIKVRFFRRVFYSGEIGACTNDIFKFQCIL